MLISGSDMTDKPVIQSIIDGVFQDLLINPNGGNVSINTEYSEGYQLNVNGTVKTKDITINGGTHNNVLSTDAIDGKLTLNGQPLGARIYKIDELLSGTFSSEDISNSVNAYVGKNLLQRVTAIETTGSQPAFNGTGFVKVEGSFISYDNSTYSLSNHTHNQINGVLIGDTIWDGSWRKIIANGYNLAIQSGDGSHALQIGYNGSFQYDNQTIWHNGNFNPANYLPLAGGNMTGQLYTTGKIITNDLFLNTNSSVGNQFLLNASGANYGAIQTLNSNSWGLGTGGGGVDRNINNTALIWDINKNISTGGNLTVAGSVTATQFRASYVGETFVCNQTDGNAYSMRINNSGGSLYVGVENSSGSYFGAGAYSSVIYSPNNSTFIKTPDALFSGTLSSIGTIYSYAGNGLRLVNNDGYISGYATNGITRQGYLQFTSNSIYISSESGSGDIALINKNAVIIRNDVGGVARIQLTGSQGAAKQYSLLNGINGVSNTGFSIRNDSNSTTPFYIDGSDNSYFSGQAYFVPYLPAVISGAGMPYYGTNITLSSDTGSQQGAVRIWGRYDNGFGGGSQQTHLSFEVATNLQAYNGDPRLLTYVERMRLTSAGNLVLGFTTDQNNKLAINGTALINGNINLSSNTNIRTIWGGVNGGCVQILSDPSTTNRWVRMGVCGSTGDFYAGLSITNDGNSVFSGTVGATQFNGSGAGLTGIASSLTVGTLMNTGGGGICSSVLGTGYNYAVCMREVSGYGGYTGGEAAPRLGFHWGGVVASSISIGTNGSFYLNNDPGTGRENLYISNLYGSSLTMSGDIYGANYHSNDINATGDITSAGQIKAVQFKTGFGGIGMIGDYSEAGTTSKIIWTIGSGWASLSNHYGIGYCYENIANFGHSIFFADNGNKNAQISLSTGSAKFNGSVTASSLNGNGSGLSNVNADTVDGVHIWKGSLSAYNALSKDSNTMYIII